MLTDGEVFDQNERAPLPVDGVVPGFSEGLQLMKRGGKYRLWIPPQLGYGSDVPEGGPIPKDSVLMFDVELRSEARRVGKECVSTCRSRGSADHKKKK